MARTSAKLCNTCRSSNSVHVSREITLIAAFHSEYSGFNRCNFWNRLIREFWNVGSKIQNQMVSRT